MLLMDGSLCLCLCVQDVRVEGLHKVRLLGCRHARRGGTRVWWCPVARSDLIITHRHSPQDVDELFTYPSFAAAPNFQLRQNRRGMNVSKFSDSSFNAGECDTATTAIIHS